MGLLELISRKRSKDQKRSKWHRNVRDPTLKEYLKRNPNVQVYGEAINGVSSYVYLVRRGNTKFILKFADAHWSSGLLHLKQEIEVLEKCKEAGVKGVAHIIRSFEIPKVGRFLEKEYIEKTDDLNDVRTNKKCKAALLETVKQIHNLGYGIVEITLTNLRIKNKRAYIVDLGSCRELIKPSQIKNDLHRVDMHFKC
tara:strand:- start:5071 stop:5661 length:591 start_codon:yes stop_codon:yes gene_type:complete